MAESSPTDLFLSLVPERVLEAVDRAGLSSRPVCYPLNSFENRVYEVEIEDRRRVIAKFYRPGRWSAAQILEEHAFLAELAAAEIPVCAVRPFPDGNTLKEIDGIYYCLFDRRGGRSPDELDDGAVLRLGRFVARMHNVAVGQEARHRPVLSGQTYVREHIAWLADRGVVPPRIEKRYFDTAAAIAAIAEEQMEGVALHRIHADLHLGNVLFRDGELVVYDFDDMRTGPAVQDLWLALPGRDPATLRQRDVFLQGYEELRAFDRTTLRLVEPLRGLRMVHYATWLAQRYHDPAFQLAWPQFGSVEYWRQEADDLEDQLAAVHGELPSSAQTGTETVSTAAEETLTNQDYFWDWEGD